mgnify:CR=1 FL=1
MFYFFAVLTIFLLSYSLRFVTYSTFIHSEKTMSFWVTILQIINFIELATLESFPQYSLIIQKIIEILISQLENSSDQQVNALFMIYYAFIYESNFFRLSDSNFGFTQNFTITYNDLEFSLDCSFHSFNTTTRLYSVISEKLNIKINSFVIKMVDGMNEITIQYNTPLQAINMRPLQTIIFGSI